MFIIGTTGVDVNEYSLSTAFDVSSASFSELLRFSVVTAPNGMSFNDDGTKMYVIGNSGDDVNEYSLSTVLMYQLPVTCKTFQ